MSDVTTTILGKTYRGRPMMGTVAFGLWKYEQDGRMNDAEKLLKAHNAIRRVWGKPAYDPQEDMTNQPMEGGFTFGRHREAR